MFSSDSVVERISVFNASAELLDRNLKSKISSTEKHKHDSWYKCMQMFAMIRILALIWPCSCIDKKQLKDIESVLASIHVPSTKLRWIFTQFIGQLPSQCTTAKSSKWVRIKPEAVSIKTCPVLPWILPWGNIEATKSKVNFSANSNQSTNSLTHKLTVNQAPLASVDSQPSQV